MDEKVLLELGKYVVEAGRLKGASDIEVLVHSVSDVDVNIESGEISGVEKRLSDQMAIRLYVGKRMGAAFINIPTKKAADEAISMALASARVTTEDKDWVSLPEPMSYPIVTGLWNEDVAMCEPQEAVEIAGDFMDRAIKAESGLIPAYGGSGVNIVHSAYANSRGINISEKENAAYAYLGAIAQIEGGVTPMIIAFDIKRNLELELDKAVEDLAKMIRICKNCAKGRTGKHTVVFHPWAYSQILGYTLIQSVKGDNVARGKSKLDGKIGEIIASEDLTLIDNGTVPRGMNSSISDDEGVPRQKTSIIENGTLKSFLWDTYWANKKGENSTGNAKRSMRQGLVEIAPSNIVVEPGRRGIDKILSEIKHGYLIRNVQGAHSSNPESGDFSVVGNPAILIEDGDPKGAVHGLMVSGNVFDLLKKFVEASRDTHVLQSLIGPELVFKDVNIIAR